MSEKSFQNYFMKIAPHAYRTSLTSGSGFPDLIMFHDKNNYSLIELKLLSIGPSGDKKLKNTFQLSQPPWYAKYIHKGGERVFVVFKLNNGYGLLKVTKEFLDRLDTLTYKSMLLLETYSEHLNLRVLIREVESEK